MIKISTKSQTTTIYPAKHWSPSNTSLTITFKSTVRNDEHSFEVSDESGYTDFFVFSVDTSEMEDGEYAYFVTETGEDAILSSGLMKIGEWEPYNEEYNETVEYKEYEY